MDVRQYEQGDVFLNAPWRSIPSDALDILFMSSASVSIFQNQDIVACIGLTNVSVNCGQVFTLISDRIKDNPKEISEEVLKALTIGAAYKNFKKIYTTVSDGSEIEKKWIERLGFVEEYRMLQAADGGYDYIGYVKIFKEGEL
jgi:hypothetical protein